MFSDDSPKSSENGSGIQSPVFGATYSLPHGDNFRHQYDQTEFQRATASYTPRYDYMLPMNSHLEQHPFLANQQEPPNTNSDNVPNFAPSTPSFHLQSRMQTELTYSPLLSAAVVHPQSAPSQGYRQIDHRFMPPADDLRRIPGDSVHDSSYTRHTGHIGIPSMQAVILPMPSGHHHPEASGSNQAATTNSSKQRKEISNVVIACNQCRSRKIRCDSKRPTCNNCARRSNVCAYDSVPKRRGPDKHPGTRQRRPKKRSSNDPALPTPKRRRTVSSEQTDPRTTMAMNIRGDKTRQLGPNSQIPSPGSSLPAMRSSTDSGPLYKSDSPLARGLYGYNTGTSNYSYAQGPAMSSLCQPAGMNNMVTPSDRKMQWNGILTNYGLNQIADAFTYLSTDAAQWFYFLNIDHLIISLSDGDKRIHIQPAFIYASLALAMLMKSSEKGRGMAGREEALRLFGLAQSALSNSYRSGWIDIKLAAAALIMALFESSLHPLYSPDRLVRALHDLDDIVRTLKPTQKDASDPLATKFPVGSVPTIPETISYGRAISKRCSCLPPGVRGTIHASQAYPLPWNAVWTDEEIEAEEYRRVCWNALAVVTNYNTLCVCLGREPVNFWLADPGNYALSFPGEVIDRVSSSFGAESAESLVSPKESVWALYCRSMLLFNFCTRLIWGNLGAEDKSEFATEIMNETMSLQDSLDAHSCNINTPIMLRCQELIQNSRFIIKRTFRSIQGFEDDPGRPFLSRGEADQWLSWTKQIIDQVESELSLRQDGTDKPGSMWTRKPFDITWYSSQLALSLRVWNHDRSLLSVLDLGKVVLRVVDALNRLWPNSFHQRHCEELRRKLIDACSAVGIQTPLPSHFHAVL